MSKLICISLFVSLAILSLPLGVAAQATRSEREIDEIKLDVSRLYRDSSRKIAVRLMNGRSIMGYIKALDVDDFTMVDAKTNKDFVIRYADVAKIDQTGLSKTQKTVLVAAGIGALVTIGIIFRPKAKGGLRCLLCH